MHDISLTIPEGKITAIVGQSGCGKTTFLKTLNRMIEEEGGFYKGKIILDGEDIKGLSTEVLRTRIGNGISTADRISVQYREESVIRPEISWN